MSPTKKDCCDLLKHQVVDYLRGSREGATGIERRATLSITSLSLATKNLQAASQGSLSCGLTLSIWFHFSIFQHLPSDPGTGPCTLCFQTMPCAAQPALTLFDGRPNTYSVLANGCDPPRCLYPLPPLETPSSPHSQDLSFPPSPAAFMKPSQPTQLHGICFLLRHSLFVPLPIRALRDTQFSFCSLQNKYSSMWH